MTTKEKLTAALDAYGYLDYMAPNGETKCRKYVDEVGENVVLGNQHSTYETIPLIVLLMNTERCKAAYGEEDYYAEVNFVRWKEEQPFLSSCYQKHDYISERILNSWHNGKGNNYQEAINTAYNLLNNS